MPSALILDCPECGTELVTHGGRAVRRTRGVAYTDPALDDRWHECPDPGEMDCS